MDLQNETRLTMKNSRGLLTKMATLRLDAVLNPSHKRSQTSIEQSEMLLGLFWNQGRVRPEFGELGQLGYAGYTGYTG